jgi:hypothetical protein
VRERSALPSTRPIQPPRANSAAERWVGTARRECLDHLIPISERHLRRVLSEFVGTDTSSTSVAKGANRGLEGDPKTSRGMGCGRASAIRPADIRVSRPSSPRMIEATTLLACERLSRLASSMVLA